MWDRSLIWESVFFIHQNLQCIRTFLHYIYLVTDAVIIPKCQINAIYDDITVKIYLENCTAGVGKHGCCHHKDMGFLKKIKKIIV